MYGLLRVTSAIARIEGRVADRGDIKFKSPFIYGQLRDGGPSLE